MTERRIKAVRPEQEYLIRLIREIAQEEDAANAPRMGKIVDDAGTRPRVRMDDEDEDRTIGFPRKLGNRYPKGSKVRVERVRTGTGARGSYEEIITGIISDEGGDSQRVVGEEDLRKLAIDNEKLNTNAVDARVIADNGIEARNLRGSSVTRDKIASGAIDGSKLDDKVVTTAKLESGLANKIQDAVSSTTLKNTEDRLDGQIAKAQSAAEKAQAEAAGSVKSGQLAKGAMGTKPLATEEYVIGRKYATETKLAAELKSMKAYIDNKIKESRGGE